MLNYQPMKRPCRNCKIKKLYCNHKDTELNWLQASKQASKHRIELEVESETALAKRLNSSTS